MKRELLLPFNNSRGSSRLLKGSTTSWSVGAV